MIFDKIQRPRSTRRTYFTPSARAGGWCLVLRHPQHHRGICSWSGPAPPSWVVAVFFGVWLIVSGIVQLVQGFNKELDTGQRVLAVIVGVISIVLNPVLPRWYRQRGLHPESVHRLSFLFRGIWQLIVGLQSKGVSGRGC